MYPYILSPASATEHLRNFKYEYDRLNRLEKFTLSGGDTAGGVYTYDRLNRLYSAQIVSGVEAQTVHDQTYTYTMDEFGNVLAQNAPYPGDPALPKAMSVSLSPATNRLITSSYDLLGNQTLLDRPGDQPDLRLIYQGQGHIHLVKNPTTGEQFGYYYDTEGKRRIKAKMIPDPSNPTNYIPDLVNDVSFSFYEGEDLICQQDRGEFVVDYLKSAPFNNEGC